MRAALPVDTSRRLIATARPLAIPGWLARVARRGVMGIAGLLIASASVAQPQPSVVLPPEIDRVLRDYERAWMARDAEALARLFVPAGMALPNGQPPARGADAIRQVYAGPAGTPLALRPLAYESAGDLATVVGAYAGAPGRPDIGKFVLVLRRGADGRWGIAADIDNLNATPTAPAPPAAAASTPAAAEWPLYAVEITTGPRWDAARPPQEQPLFREHSAHLRQLRERGHIITGARYADKGLLVLSAADEASARALMDADPSMQAGTFRYQLHPYGVFYGGTLRVPPRAPRPAASQPPR